MPRKLTEEELDSVAKELIPKLNKVAAMAEDIGFTDKSDTGGFISREAEQLVWAIEGQALMVTNTPAPLRDGSYRIVLSPSQNWVVQSMMMSGLDSSTEIVLILAPKI